MRDPFAEERKQRKKIHAIDIDGWINSTIYHFFVSLKKIYTHFRVFMARFELHGIQRFLSEILSDGLTFVTLGFLGLLILSLPAFRVAHSTAWEVPEVFYITFLDRHGNYIGERGQRFDDSTRLDDMPIYLIQSVLATEDRRFYEHYGIDFMGTIRAMIANAQSGTVVQGGSTLTQQVVKNLFVGPERSYTRKINEAIISFWLEARLTKNQILKLYLDRAYFGGGNLGVGAASQFYFNKKVSDLSIQEAAMIAGLPKAPSKYAPHVDIGAARERANEVLANLVEANFMTDSQLVEARQNPASVVERPKTYSPDYFLDWAYDDVVSTIRSKTKERQVVAKTTIDLDMQKIAERIAERTFINERYRKGFDQLAMVSMDPNGAVRAMVGGVGGYKKSQFNRAVSALRQPGSSFKIFTYATALKEGLSSRSVINDRMVCYGVPLWCPKNYTRRFYGRVSLRTALTKSFNTVPVQLSMRYGTKKVAQMAYDMGVTSKIQTFPSMALGASGVSVLDMTTAYSVFANGGYQVRAHSVDRVIDNQGQIIYESNFNPQTTKRLFDDREVREMNRMLHNVVVNGTAKKAAFGNVHVAGKTGTTQSYNDAWFVGFTGNQVAAFWFGNDDSKPTRRITGGSLPAESWRRYMAAIHRGKQVMPIPGLGSRRVPAFAAVNEDDEDIPNIETTNPIKQSTVQITQEIKRAIRNAPALDPLSALNPRKLGHTRDKT